MMTRTILLVCLSMILTTVGKAQEFVAGWEGSPSSGYTFASPIFSFPNEGKHKLVIRPTISYLYYDSREAGGTTKVRSPGFSLQVGYRRQTERLSLTIAPGIEVRRDRRTLATGEKVEKTQVGAVIGMDAFYQATRLTNLNFIASYGAANRYLFTRAGVKQQVTNKDFSKPVSLLVGAEVTAQGNRDIKQYGVGGLFEVAFPKKPVSLQFRTGYNRKVFADSTSESKPYFGAGIYYRF
jgi:hypothetical protein